MNECGYTIYGAFEAYETFQKLPRAKLTAQLAPCHQSMSPRALLGLCLVTCMNNYRTPFSSTTELQKRAVLISMLTLCLVLQ